MTIIVAHNYYQLPGGEDRVFETEIELLRSRGHEVLEFSDNNSRIAAMGQVRLGLSTLWSRDSYRKLARLVRTSRAQVVHFHNTFPLLSPSCYYAAKREGAAVVQTLHNYRLLCPSAVCYRAGHVCEDCVGRSIPWPSVLHGCYRGDRTATMAVASMISLHRLLKTWTHTVDAYIALTEFARNKFVLNALPPGKVHIKPVFLAEDPGLGSGNGGYALFVGRLVEEKGLRTLLAAWDLIENRIPLRIVGNGPLSSWLKDRIAEGRQIEWSERVSRTELWTLIKRAQFLVVPSTWYEGLPGIVVEAFAAGCPVIASDIGSLSSVVQHCRTGLHFKPGDHEDLARTMQSLLEEPALGKRLAATARGEFEECYTADASYRRLLQIYAAARRGNSDECGNETQLGEHHAI